MPDAQTPSAEHTHEPWSALERVAFRIVFVYLGFFGTSWLIGHTPLLTRILDALYEHAFGKWIVAGGREAPFGAWAIVHVLGFPPHSPQGVGGESLTEVVNYVGLFLFACVAAGIWSVLDRRSREYSRLYTWLYAVVRFALAAIMFDYGWSKLLPEQFNGGRIPLNWLVRPLSDFAPNQLLWSYMGFSRAYSMFAGAGELLGALLLCFRRTATAGALVLIAVLSNVFLVNVAYDVGLAPFVGNLLLMAAFIAARDLRRIVDVFVMSRSVVAPTPLPSLFTSPRGTMFARAGAMCLTLVLLGRPITSMLPDLRAAGGAWGARPALFGIFDAMPATRGATSSPVDLRSWHRIIFETAGVYALTDSGTMRFDLAVDTVAHHVTLRSARRGTFTFAYAERGDTLDLSVSSGDAPIQFQRRPHERFALLAHRHTWSW